MLGAGEMGESMAIALAGAGVGEIVVANRTPSRGEALATRVGGRAVGLDDVPEELVTADVLLSSTGADEVLIERSDMELVMQRRDGRALTLNPTSRKLLEFLMRETGRIVPREELEYLIWGDAPPDADVLRAHMHKLREALDREFERKLLHTFRGAGYRLADLG